MRLRSHAFWVKEAKRAEAVRPTPLPERQLVLSRSDHWVRQLPLAGGFLAYPDQTAMLSGVYLQARESHTPRSAITQTDAIAILLAMSWSRTDRWDEAGRPWSSRLAPSAGGTHSVEPMLWWGERWYVAVEGGASCAVVPEATSVRLVNLVRDAANSPTVSAALFAVADPRFVSQRYPEATSHLWRDAGAFLTVSHLVAQAIGREGHIAGIAASLDEKSGAMVVGALLIGAGSV